MDIKFLIDKFKEVDRASISDIDILMEGGPLLAKEAAKLLDKIRKFEKRYPNDGSESEYDLLKKEIKEKEKEISQIKTRQKNESIMLRKEIGKTGKHIEDLKIQIEKEVERSEKYKMALKQSEFLIEDLKRATSSDDDIDEIKRLKSELNQKNSEILSLKNDNTISKLNNEINILQKGISRAELELNEFKNTADHEKSNLLRQMKEAKQDAANSKNALEQAQYTIMDLKKRVSNDFLKREIERLQKELEAAGRTQPSSNPPVYNEPENNLLKKLELSEAKLLRVEQEKNSDRKIYRSKIEESYKEIERLRNLLKIKSSESEVSDDSEIQVLKDELKKAKITISNLRKFKPPTSKTGKSNNSSWKIDYDEDKNIIFFNFAGIFSYNDAKKASRNVESVIKNVRKNFTAVCDITHLEKKFDNKTSFQIRKLIFMFQSSGLKELIRIAPGEKKQFLDAFDIITRKKKFIITDLDSSDDLQKKL